MEKTANDTENRAARAVVMIGGPAAGKSTVVARDYGDLKLLDCDVFKARHPDYDPRDPGAVHAWSRAELQREFFATLGAGEDFVLDGTGTSIERYVTWMAAMTDAGYEIEIVYVKTTLNVALERNRNRARVVAENIVREKHAVVEASFSILSERANATRIVVNN